MAHFYCIHCEADYFVAEATDFFRCPNDNCYAELKPMEKPKPKDIDHCDCGELDLEVGNTELEREVFSVLQRAFRLWRTRQAKYGPTNIATTGALGCYVRSADKVARLREVYINANRKEMKDESIIDSWIDLLNYACMGILCEEKTWPGL